MSTETVFPPVDPVRLPVLGDSRKFPVRHIHCVGQNYAEHAREMGADPDRTPPFFFCKMAQAAVGGSAEVEVPYPSATERLGHEVELVVAIGPEAKIFGYAVGIDLTRRDLQTAAKDSGRPWDLAKSFTGAAPMGPIHRIEDVGRLQTGGIALDVNGKKRQDGDLSLMIWSVDEVLESIARYDRLYPGDLVFTGTPAGVGLVGRGDRMDARIAGLDPIRVTLV